MRMHLRSLLASLSLPLVLMGGCDLDLPPGDVSSPHYWGDAFLDKYAAELVVGELEPGPEPLAQPRVVLLITGVTIPAQWFDPMVARLERDGFIPVVYEPPELLSGDLFENSELLADVVEQVREEYGEDKIDILAECTGGLIARHYIQSLGGEDKVSRLVTFISPQAGLPKAAWAEPLAGWPALTDLTPDSEFLQAVADVPLPESIPVTSIYTCTDEYIQPYTTSIIPGATNIGLCDEFVGHFQFFYDPEIYLVMHDALTQPADAPALPGEDSPDEEAEDASEDADEDEDADAGEDAEVGCSVGGGSPGWMFFGLGIALLNRRRRSASKVDSEA